MLLLRFATKFFYYTHNLSHHNQIKHIEVNQHLMKEKIDSGLACTPYVSTKWQFADVLTKGLTSHQFK